MVLNPPISQRTTKELLAIISNDKKCSNEIQQLAEQELLNRNLTKQLIEEERKKRLIIISNYNKRRERQLNLNKLESYNFFEMLSIVILFPFSLFFKTNPIEEFRRLDNGNYNKKIWQRILLIAISLILYYQLLRIVL